MTLDGTKMKAGLAGAGLLAALAAARFAASASESAVFIGGRELHWACPVKSLLGMPCPSCGMTRSVVLALGGDLRGALALNPGGPLVLLGLLALAAALLLVALRPPGAQAPGLTARKLVPLASAYGALTLAVMLANWVRALV